MSRFFRLSFVCLLVLFFCCSFLFVSAEEKKKELDPALLEVTVSLYELLGVDKAATASEIKKAYRTAAKKWHPDLASDDEERVFREKKMLQFTHANSILSNEKKRADYDYLLRNDYIHWDEDALEKLRYEDEHGIGTWADHVDLEPAAPGEDAYESMALTETSALVILLICAPVALLCLLWPVYAFFEKKKSKADAKVAAKKQILVAKEEALKSSTSMKKYTPRYTGDRSTKRFTDDDKKKRATTQDKPEEGAASPSPDTTPANSLKKRSTAGSNKAVWKQTHTS